MFILFSLLIAACLTDPCPSVFQKPYACQLQGCTKRYTDPSSLRKHVKNHGLRQKATHTRRRSHKETGSNTTSRAAARGKKRCHSESSVKSHVELLSIPETVASADEDDNNYYDLMYNETFEDDEVFTGNSTEMNTTQMTQDNNASTINMNELTCCLDKIQNSDTSFDEVDYANLFASMDAANDVEIIDKLINSNDFEQNEFVPFEYVKKLMDDDSTTTMANSMPTAIGNFNQSCSMEPFSYGLL